MKVATFFSESGGICTAPSQVNPTRFTPEQEAKIREMFVAGKPLRSIQLAVRSGARRLNIWLADNNLSRSTGFTPKQEATIREMFAAGEPLKNIRAVVQSGEQRLRDWLADNDLTRPALKKTFATAEQRAKIRQMHRANASIDQISLALGVSHWRIRQWLTEWGLYEVRSRSRALTKFRPEEIDCGGCGGTAFWGHRSQRYTCFSCRWQGQ